MLTANNKSSPSFANKTSSFETNHLKVDFAIFSAMPEELNFLFEKFSNYKCEEVQVESFKFKIYEYKNKRMLLAYTGLGTTFASSIVTLIHTYFKPEYIFFTGTAGGINKDIKLCDVVIAESAFEAEIQGAFSLLKGTPFESCLTHPLNKKNFPSVYTADPRLLEIVDKINLNPDKNVRGTVVTSNTFPAPAEMFEKIKSMNPCSIDMETSAFYQVAWLLDIPSLAIRGISNLLNHDGTDHNVHQSDVKGSALAASKTLLNILDEVILQNQIELNDKVNTSSEIKKIIEKLNLQPHPEGGFYTRNFQSKDKVISSDSKRFKGEERHASTSIYYLLYNDNFSAWHRIKSDELWHYYEGTSAIDIHVIDKEGNLKSYILGNSMKIDNATFQVVVEAGSWFAAGLRDKDSYGLAGCTVSPGFEFKDFELADNESLTNYSKTIKESFIKQFLRSTENISALDASSSKITMK